LEYNIIINYYSLSKQVRVNSQINKQPDRLEEQITVQKTHR